MLYSTDGEPLTSPAARPPLISDSLAHLTFYAIDGEETHRTYRDPDDAVALETLQDGSSILHVAVVDSTAIPLGSLSDKQAARRGESAYYPSYVSMLEKHWYEDIGLWNGKQRALVTSVHLDTHGAVIGTTVSRAYVHVESFTHGEAAAAMQQPEHPLTRMAARMKELRQHREQATHRIHTDSETGLEVGLEGTVSGWRPEAPGLRRVHGMIQEAMILCNSAVANWANQSGLPFIYRNHGPEVPGFEIGSDPIAFDVHQLRAEDDATRAETRERIRRFIGIRAQYQATCHGHEGVGSAAYAHTTSPLRRYVDIVNQRMLDYAMGILTPVEAWLTSALPEEERGFARQELWRRAGELIRPVYAYHDAPTADKADYFSDCLHALQKLQTLTQDHGSGYPMESASDLALRLLEQPLIPLPYHLSDLQQIAEHLNKVMEVPQAEKKRLSEERLESWLRRVMKEPDPSILAMANTDEFTNLIKRAATTGQINEELFQEIRSRIEEHRGIRPVATYAGILMNAPEDADTVYHERGNYGKGYWRQLKDIILKEIKFDAGTVDDVLENIQEMSGGKFSIVMENQNLKDMAGHPVHASLCVAKMQDEVLAAPSYVTMPEGHATLARAMARHHFLEALAAKSLRPLSEVPLPDTMSASIRRVMYPVDLLLDVAAQHGIHYHITQCEWNSDRRRTRRADDPESDHGYSASITLSGEKIAGLVADTPERGSKYRAAGALWCRKNSELSMEDALARAARNLLGKPEVEQLLPKDIIVDYTTPEDPLKLLQKEEKTGNIRVAFTTQRQNGGHSHQRIYEVNLLIQRPGDEAVLFSERLTSPDEPHARFELARKAVEHLREHGFIDNSRQDSPAQLPLFSPENRVSPPHHHTPPYKSGPQLT